MENFLKLVISLHFDLNYICDLVREALGHTKTILSLFIIFVIAEHEHKNYTISIYYCYVIIIIIAEHEHKNYTISIYYYCYSRT